MKKFCLESTERGKFCESNLRGKTYLIDFWASWCPRCIQSLGWLSEIEKKFPRSSFGFAAFNLDQNRNDALLFLKQNRLKTEVVFDTQGSQAEACGLTGVPGIVLIDRKGNIVQRWNGYSAAVQDEILKGLERQRDLR